MSNPITNTGDDKDSETKTDITIKALSFKSLVGWIGNISAVTLICIMFYQAQNTQYAQAKEDRAMFREELKFQRLHDDESNKIVIQLLNQNLRCSEETLKSCQQNSVLLGQLISKVKLNNGE